MFKSFHVYLMLEASLLLPALATNAPKSSSQAPRTIFHRKEGQQQGQLFHLGGAENRWDSVRLASASRCGTYRSSKNYTLLLIKRPVC